jgi:excisionase family DNA binding protein
MAGDGPLILPRAVVVMLASMLAQLAEGCGVTLMPSHAELTTVEAASMLNVSRPYLIKLIDSGELPARLVGRHRRIRSGDLTDYKRRTDASAHQAADDLITLSEELGLYE